MAATLPSEPGQSARKPITFDEANAAYEATGQVGFRADQQPGQEFVPGAYVQGGAPVRPKLYEAPQPAPEGNLGAAIKDNFAQDEGTRLKLIAEELFPGDPNGLKRVGIRNGKPVFLNDEGKLQYVSGTKSNILGGLIGSLPELAGGIAGSFAGSPVLGSTAGATAGRALKRVASKLLFDEPVTAKSLGTELAVEAGTNLVGGLLGKGAAKFFDRGRVVDFSPARLQQAEAIRQNVLRQTGIDLDLAQASGDRRLIRLRDFAARYPGESAQVIQAADDAAAGQFDIATNRVLDLVSRPLPSGQAGEAAINTAKEVIDQTRRGIQKEVKPFYDAAYAAKTEIKNPRILKLAELPEVSTAINDARSILNLRAGKVVALQDQPLSLELLDYAKQNLDDQVEVLAAKGLNRKAAALAGARDQIKGFLDNVSRADFTVIEPTATPGQVISLYKTARQLYGKLTEERLNPLQNGLVGTLSRLDPQRAAVASGLFKDTGVTPQQIALLKSSLESQDPQAYSGLVRQYLTNAYDEAQQITQGGDVTNVPGKFLKRLAPTPSKLDNLKALLPANTVPVLEGLLDAAEALARTPLGATRVAGSSTFGDTQLSEILKGRAVAVTKALITPRQAIRDAVELRAQEEGIQKLTEALVDPAKRDQLRRIVKMKDTTKQAILLGGLLGTQATAGAVQDQTENAGIAQ